MTTTAVDSSDYQTKLSPADRRELCRALAAKDERPATLARRYGVSRQYVAQFAQQHATEIRTLRDKLDDDFAGLWIADKGARIAAYQDDYERSLDHPRYGDSFEHIRTRTQISQAVAEELGQLPPRQQISVQSVTHVIVGVDLDALT
jgi:hypothetical protein